MSAVGLIGRRPTRLRPRLRFRRRGVLAALLAVLVAGVLLGGYLWLRGSSLVSVDQVTVRGVAGPDAPRIRAALTSAAHGMTTLEIRLRTLREAVAPYPIVAGVRAIPHVPHRLTIDVVERLPVAAASVAGMRVGVAADGTVLRDVATGGLPEITLRAVPGGPRVTEPAALSAVRLLAGAPRAILGAVASVVPDASYGLVATLRKGPTIRFGDATLAAAKWQAVLALLAVPQNAGAAYLDVTDPHRPAAGVSPAAAAAAGASMSGAGAASGTGPAAAGVAGGTVAPGTAPASASAAAASGRSAGTAPASSGASSTTTLGGG